MRAAFIMCVMFALVAVVAAQQVPETPQPQRQQHCVWFWTVPRGSLDGMAVGHEECRPLVVVAKFGEARPTAGFTTWRTSWKSPALRPRRAVWVTVLLANAGAWGAVAYDVHVNRNRPGQQETKSEYIAVGGINALSYASMKLFNGGMALGPPAAAIGHYLHDAFK